MKKRTLVEENYYLYSNSLVGFVGEELKKKRKL